MKLIVPLLLALVFSIDAQAQELTFERSYALPDNQESASLRRMGDGGFMIAGATKVDYTSLKQARDGLLLRTDSNGTLLWTKSYGSIGDDWFESIATTSDGGVVATGTYQRDNVGGTRGSDIWVVKTNAAGDTLWTGWYGGLRSDYGHGISPTTDGGYIIVGQRYISQDTTVVTLIKIGATGAQQWERIYRANNQFNDAGGVIALGDGGYFLTAVTRDEYGHDTTYALRTDDQGVVQWKTRIDASDAPAARQLADGGFVVASEKGYLLGTLSLARLDATGNMSWRSSDTRSSMYLAPGNTNLARLEDGGYAITGSVTSMIIARTDSVGKILWRRTYGGSDTTSGHAIDVTDDGGIVVTGTIRGIGSQTGADIYLVRTDGEGYVTQPAPPDPEWRRINYTGAPVRALAIDSSGTILVAEGASPFGESVPGAALLYRSTDAGASWSTYDPGYEFGALVTTPGGEIIGVPATRFNETLPIGTLVRSTDHGTTWSAIPGAPAKFIQSLAVDLPGNLVAITKSAIYRSSDNGVSWDSVGAYGSNASWVARTNLGTLLVASPLRRSVDGFVTWKFIGTPGGTYGPIAAGSTGEAYVAVSDPPEGIARSTDDGLTWISSEFRRTFRSLLVDRKGNVYAGVGFGLGDTMSGLWRSTDHGSTWNSTGLEIYDIPTLMLDRQGYVLAGTSNGIFRNRVTSASVQERQEMAEEFSVRIVPNPISTRATLTFSFAQPRTEVTISMIDMLGREIARMEKGNLEAGSHVIELDLSKMPAGFYHLRLDADGMGEIDTIHREQGRFRHDLMNRARE